MREKIMRFVYTRHVNVLGWPSSRKRAVWRLYELRRKELWLNVADKLMATYEAAKAWLALLDEPPLPLIGFKSKV